MGLNLTIVWSPCGEGGEGEEGAGLAPRRHLRFASSDPELLERAVVMVSVETLELQSTQGLDICRSARKHHSPVQPAARVRFSF